MELLFWSFILLVALAALVKSADFFTVAAERLGLFFGLSSFVIGATIVSFGSSMPELATALFALKAGATSFAIDNIVGSNIANALLVAGIASVAVKTLRVKEQLIDVDVPFFFMSTALFILFIMDGKFTAAEGVVSLVMLGVFVVYTISAGRDDISDHDEKEDTKPPLKAVFQSLGIIVVSIIGIVISSKYTIDSVTHIAELMDIAPAIITMLAVAFGTSLPEIIISVRAAMAGRHSIALGNIFGSNTFNVLAVAGIPSFFGTLTVSPEVFTIGLPFLIVASLAFIFATSDDKIQKWEGFALLIIYVAFVGKITGMF
ncbi:MAG: calcium/sodium antiporter [Candidatus Pacebacteria bacterium]|nr:calcium/sodium antiporter [Candidatus Paceibacterota bacterium]